MQPVHFPSWQEIGNKLIEVAKPGDTIWIKGSRRMGLEKLVAHLQSLWVNNEKTCVVGGRTQEPMA